MKRNLKFFFGLGSFLAGAVVNWFPSQGWWRIAAFAVGTPFSVRAALTVTENGGAAE